VIGQRAEAPGTPTVVSRRLSAAQSATREKLIDAALELASAGGQDASGLRDVARRAGLSAATAYQYFSSRDELLVALLDRLERRSRESAQHRIDKGEPPAKRLRGLLEAVLREVRQHPRLYQAMFTAWIASHPGGDPHAALPWHGVQDSWIALALGPGPRADAVAATLDHVLLGAMVAVITEQPWEEISRTLDSAVDLLLAGAEATDGA
jgi:AcrR family transcriptional regulator